MVNYKTLSSQARPFLAMTGLTPAEFRNLLVVFETAYEQAHLADRTASGRPRQRYQGAGRPSALQLLNCRLCNSDVRICAESSRRRGDTV